MPDMSHSAPGRRETGSKATLTPIGQPAYWLRDVDWPTHAGLDRDISPDVLVLGGGITGITAAYLLTQAGVGVTLLERGRCGGFDTAATTAHLTALTDCLPSELLGRFGADRARQVWSAGEAAITEIATAVEQLGIDCGFRRVPGFLYAAHDGGEDSVRRLQAEARALQALSLPGLTMDDGPPLGRPAILFPDQAMIHPQRYLRGLLREISRCGGHVYEFTEADAANESKGSWLVKARGYEIHPRYVVVATHDPWAEASTAVAGALLQSRLTLMTTYVVAGHIADSPLPDGCFWDNAAPYRYLRVDGDRLLIGGEDHKTGQADDAADRFERLGDLARRIAPTFSPTDRWSGQVIESNDGLPLIGGNRPRQFLATAYGGNGITFGTLAGVMARDAVLGRQNPWGDLFAVGRETMLTAPLEYLRQNADYPLRFVQDRLELSDVAAADLPPGEGHVVHIDGKPVAVHRPADGPPVMLSAVCPHMGCVVRWNPAGRTWDCPCHGSRFAPMGDVLAGPATSSLAPIGIPTDPS